MGATRPSAARSLHVTYHGTALYSSFSCVPYCLPHCPTYCTGPTMPSCHSRAMSSWLRLRSSLKTSFVCSPKRGGGAETDAGVRLYFTGWAGSLILPAVAWSISAIISRARVWPSNKNGAGHWFADEGGVACQGNASYLVAATLTCGSSNASVTLLIGACEKVTDCPSKCRLHSSRVRLARTFSRRGRSCSLETLGRNWLL